MTDSLVTLVEFEGLLKNNEIDTSILIANVTLDFKKKDIKGPFNGNHAHVINFLAALCLIFKFTFGIFFYSSMIHYEKYGGDPMKR